MSIPCDIVLLPERQLSKKAVEESLKLSCFDTFFSLKDGSFYPHMSLYMFQLNEAHISEAERILYEITKEFRTIYAHAIRYNLGQGFGVGYVDSEYEVTPELSAIQEKVIERINPIRTGMRESDVRKMEDAEGLKLENLQKYGYQAVGELFRPHITLTSL